MQILGCQTKSSMVFYCIFWSGQLRTASCKYKTMTTLPKYGVLLTPKYGQKCKFYRVTQNLRVLPTLRGVIILPTSQPRFLARLPRWQ